MIKRAFYNWKRWLYKKHDSKFLFMCSFHADELRRPQDADGGMFEEDLTKFIKCDVPLCGRRASREFFPNLVTVVKDAEKGPFLTLEEFDVKKHNKRKSV